jgi:outer membrane protein assembly factor BamB
LQVSVRLHSPDLDGATHGHQVRWVGHVLAKSHAVRERGERGAVANGVVYYSIVGLTGHLLAVDAETGKTLANLFIGWGASGPSVSRGQVYVGTGTKFAAGVYTPPGLVAFGL